MSRVAALGSPRRSTSGMASNCSAANRRTFLGAVRRHKSWATQRLRTSAAAAQARCLDHQPPRLFHRRIRGGLGDRVCGLSVHDVPGDGCGYFTLIYFGPDDDAKMAPSRAMAGVGPRRPPRNAIWSCHQHTSIARQHEHLDTSEGLAVTGAATGRTPRTPRTR